MTASGGNLIGCEVNRNERAPQCGVATIEVAGEQPMTASGGNLIGCEVAGSKALASRRSVYHSLSTDVLQPSLACKCRTTAP